MKLYHYVAKGNDVLEKGLLSFANNPNADIHYYTKRSNSETKEGIVKWLEGCFEGRSRAIRVFSEPIKWTDKSPSLKKFIDNADMFSLDLQAIAKDGLIEAVYISPAIIINDVSKITFGTDEPLQKLNSIDDIDYSPVDWSKCDDGLQLRFSVVPYYLIVIKDGVIPPKYITKEN